MYYNLYRGGEFESNESKAIVLNVEHVQFLEKLRYITDGGHKERCF